MSRPQQHQQQRSETPQPTAAGDALESGLLLSPFGPGAIRTAPGTPAGAAGGASPEGTGAQWTAAVLQQQTEEDLWQQLQWQVTLGNSQEWADNGLVARSFRKVRRCGLLLAVVAGDVRRLVQDAVAGSCFVTDCFPLITYACPWWWSHCVCMS